MRWIKTRASVSLQRDSARRPSAVRRRREARVEGERSELATTRRRQSVRRLQLPAAATSVGQRWLVGKRPSAAARRGSPRARVADGESNGRRCRRRWDGGEPRATSSGDDVRRSVPHGWAMASWVEGSRGRGVAVHGEDGRRETGASCHKREKGRVEGSWRMLGRKKHPWTERNEHQNGKSTRTVNRPLREPFWVRQARPIPRHAGVKLHESRTGTGITAAAGSSAVAAMAGALCSQQWTDRWN